MSSGISQFKTTLCCAANLSISPNLFPTLYGSFCNIIDDRDVLLNQDNQEEGLPPKDANGSKINHSNLGEITQRYRSRDIGLPSEIVYLDMHRPHFVNSSATIPNSHAYSN